MTRLSRTVRKLKEVHSQLTFPKNDVEAWNMYPEFNFIYNKIFICKFQKIDFGPFPIIPKKFPVISKPIINLYGMGMNSCIIKDEEGIDLNKYPNNFWMEFFTGPHLSWDLVINQGNILYSTYFVGNQGKNIGMFDSWEWAGKYNYPNKIIKYVVETCFSNYTGSLNIETIGNKIIEVHLRMGDIDLVPCELLELILLNFVEDFTLLETKFKRIKKKNFVPIHLIPIWQKVNNMSRNDLKAIQNFLEDNWEEKIIENKDIFTYYFDNVNKAKTGDYKRWFLLATENKEKALNLKNKIEDDLQNFQIK